MRVLVCHILPNIHYYHLLLLLFSFSHCSGFKVRSNCGFNLNFPEDNDLGPFHKPSHILFICMHLHIFFYEVSDQLLCQFFLGILYILDIIFCQTYAFSTITHYISTFELYVLSIIFPIFVAFLSFFFISPCFSVLLISALYYLFCLV